MSALRRDAIIGTSRATRRRVRRGDVAIRALAYIVLCIIGLAMGMPLAWMVSTSLKDPGAGRSRERQVGADRAGREQVRTGVRRSRRGREIRGAEIGRSPKGMRLRVLAPADLAGETVTVPVEQGSSG